MHQAREDVHDLLAGDALAGAHGLGRAYQDRADEYGGCWRPEINIRVGFEILAGHVSSGSVRDAFSYYNTGKPGDGPYARDAMRRLPRWEQVVAEAETRDDFAEVPQWQWDRLLGRVLRMSAGVEGQNFNGEQYNWEQERIDGIIKRLDQIEAKLEVDLPRTR
ncbi:MAG: hypothetical protein ACRDSR_26815 [Pseudonocardiaceae bacterium]